MKENETIIEVCNEIAAFLCNKNESYGGSAFRDINLGGVTIKARDAIRMRIADKIKRLQSGKEYTGEDTWLDLLGYLVLMQAEKKWSSKETSSM